MSLKYHKTFHHKQFLKQSFNKRLPENKLYNSFKEYQLLVFHRGIQFYNKWFKCKTHHTAKRLITRFYRIMNSMGFSPQEIPQNIPPTQPFSLQTVDSSYDSRLKEPANIYPKDYPVLSSLPFDRNYRQIINNDGFK